MKKQPLKCVPICKGLKKHQQWCSSLSVVSTHAVVCECVEYQMFPLKTCFIVQLDLKKKTVFIKQHKGFADYLIDQ